MNNVNLTSPEAKASFARIARFNSVPVAKVEGPEQDNLQASVLAEGLVPQTLRVAGQTGLSAKALQALFQTLKGAY